MVVVLENQSGKIIASGTLMIELKLSKSNNLVRLSHLYIFFLAYPNFSLFLLVCPHPGHVHRPRLHPNVDRERASELLEQTSVGEWLLQVFALVLIQEHGFLSEQWVCGQGVAAGAVPPGK